MGFRKYKRFMMLYNIFLIKYNYLKKFMSGFLKDIEELPMIKLKDVFYHPYYCEENIYKLCEYIRDKYIRLHNE
jgi:hypothetical protein